MDEPGEQAGHGDHLWVLVIVAACALLEVWASWVTIGSMSGFPRIGAHGGRGGLPTDWTLAVTTEAYWGYALYSWLAAAPGRRSRRFAMWSAAAVFALSLTGQGASHLVQPGSKPPADLVVFVTSLPVTVLALIAVLVHLRKEDRDEAQKTARDIAEADRIAELEAALREAHAAHSEEADALRAELGNAVRAGHEEAACVRQETEAHAAEGSAALRAELATVREALDAAESERDSADQRAEDAESRAGILARKLAAQQAKNRRTRGPNAGDGNGPNAGGRKDPNAGPGAVPRDVDVRAEALAIYLANPDISGAKLGERVGRGERWGQLRLGEFRSASPGGGEAALPEGGESTPGTEPG